MRYAPMFFFLMLSVTVPQVSANDTAATLGAGGLVIQNNMQIAMESEELEISVHKITIRYVFRNTTDTDLDLLVAFPLPDLSGGLLYNSPVNLPNDKSANFLDFAVTSNGRPVRPTLEIRAFNGENDITTRLKSVGLSGDVLLEHVNKELIQVSATQREILEREELLVPDDFNPPLSGIGKKGWWAAWTMRAKFYWKQHFPANRTIDLVQTYRPVVGGSYIRTEDDGKWSVDRYCGSSETLQRIAEVKKRHPLKQEGSALLQRTVDYILMTANNWKGPIGSFRLIISTDSPDDILATCMTGLKKINATRYGFEKANFRPTADLKLVILQPAKPN